MANWESNASSVLVGLQERRARFAYAPREFMRMLGTFGGWGMRIEFVPDDELHERPDLVVKEPEDDE